MFHEISSRSWDGSRSNGRGEGGDSRNSSSSCHEQSELLSCGLVWTLGNFPRKAFCLFCFISNFRWNIFEITIFVNPIFMLCGLEVLKRHRSSPQIDIQLRDILGSWGSVTRVGFRWSWVDYQAWQKFETSFAVSLRMLRINPRISRA